MAKKNYGDLEQHIIKTFKDEGKFVFNGVEYNVLIVDKPRPVSGECKTDVFVLGEDDSGKKIQLKISAKLEKSNEFQENKVSATKAEAYFGENWAEIVSEATKSIRHKFEGKELIYASRRHPVCQNSITLGWKLEIANKARALCAEAPLTHQEVRDFVYKGTNQPVIKKNATVSGNIVENSGVAEYLLVSCVKNINSTDDIICNLKLIDEVNFGKTYLIFTANNYRTDVKKADGPRPLAVCIKWHCKNNKLCPTICFDEPLKYTGEGDMTPILLEALKQLGKNHPSEFNPCEDLISEKIFLS